MVVNIMLLEERNMITKAVRWLFAWIDWVFYNFISILMQTIFDIANFTLSEGIFEKLIDRVYLILGIFMLFKITISLLTYLVNPDKISDKENGVGKLSMRIVLVLVMLVMLPSGFQLLNDVQNALLPTLPRLILDSSNGENSVNNLSNYGEKIAISIYGAFFYDNPDCTGGDPTGVTPYNQTTVDLDYMVNNVNLSCQTTSNGSMYQYKYTPIISTLAGGFMCYVLIGICITVAIRMFKMMILRMIAPIPIISYVDPKASKDGTFSKWVKILSTTWLELFINLGILYLIVFLVNELLINSAGQLWDATQGFGFIRKSFFIVFVIMGLFAFARQAPKFIMDALGIKNQGNFMRAMGLSSVALGGIGAGIGAARASWQEGGLNKLKAAPRGLLNGFGSIGAGGNAILTSDKPTLSTGYDAQQKYNAQTLNRIHSGSTALGRFGAVTSGLFTGQTPADKYRKRSKELDDALNALKDYKSTVESRFDGDDAFTYSVNINGKNFSGNYNVTARMVAAAQNGDADAQNWIKSHGIDTAWFTENQNDIRKAGLGDFAISGKDSVVIEKTKDTKSKLKNITVDEYDEFGNKTGSTINLGSFNGSYSDSKKFMGSTTSTKGELERSDKYKKAMVDDKESKK